MYNSISTVLPLVSVPPGRSAHAISLTPGRFSVCEESRLAPTLGKDLTDATPSVRALRSPAIRLIASRHLAPVPCQPRSCYAPLLTVGHGIMSAEEARGASKAIHKFVNDLWETLDLAEKLGVEGPEGDTPTDLKADTIELLEALMEDMVEQSYVRGAEAGVTAVRDMIKANGGVNPTNGLSRRAWKRIVRKRMPLLDDFRAFEAPW